SGRRCGKRITSRMDAESEEHHQAIDADAETGGRRHSVLERPNVVGIVKHRLFIALIFAGNLGTEPGGLVLGIIQLRESVGDLAARDEELEAIRQEWIG